MPRSASVSRSAVSPSRKTEKKTPDESGVVGRVMQARSNHMIVMVEGRPVECLLRGRFRQDEMKEGHLAAVGDLVRVRLMPNDTGVIEAVLPRTSVLGRARPMKAPQIIAANVDQALLVFAAALPDPDNYQLYQLDKLLVQAQSGNLAPLICCNKIDLRPESRETFAEYTRLGFPVVTTSAKTGEGVEELRERMAGKISVLCGPSGVGKSSLINHIQPGLQLRTGDVSDWTRKGKHTTTSAEMYDLGPETWIVDTPGIRRLDLWEVPKEDVCLYFPEMDDLWESCDAPDCLHLEEGGCAVRAAAERGEIGHRRYESYKSIVQDR